MNLGQHQPPGEIARKLRQLFFDFGDGFAVFALFSFRLGDGVERRWGHFHVSAVIQSAQVPAKKSADVAAPRYPQNNPANGASNRDDKRRRVVQAAG